MGNRFNRIVIVLTMLIGVSVPGALRAGAQELVMDFSAPRNVSNAQGVSQAADIALDPGGGIYLVWEDRSVELALFSHSLDRGTTFAEPVALVPGFEDYSYGQSRVASSHPGEVGVVFTIYDVHYGGAEIAYTGSGDGGNSFSQPIVISESDAFNSIVPNIATGWATAVVWYDTNLETGETAIRYTQSVDGGNAFMAPRRLDGSQGQVGCADVALGGEGSVYVAWLQNNDPFGAEDDWEVFFTRSDDHGVTFSAPVNISRYPQKSWCPRMAVDGAGTVYLVWAEGSYWTDMKPLFTRSDDGGGSFAEPRALVGPLLSHEPAIAASGAGNVWISWLTGDPTDRLYGFVMRSTDSGVNFSPAVPLPGGVEIASVESDVVHVVWNEVPQGESWADIFYSRGIVSQWGDAEMPATVVRDDDDDTITLALGDYIVDGGGGIDTLVLPLFPNVYQFTKIGANQYTAQYLDYTLSIDNVEYVQFGAEFQTRLPIAALRDGTVQGQLTRLTDLYLAFFGRAPDVSGLEYWQKRHLEEGRDTTLISMDFSWSEEARALFPLGESNRNFVKTVYQNCFGRDPDPDGWDYWTNKLNQLDPQAPEYLNDRGAFVGELLLGAYAETSGVEDRSLLINRHEVALAYVNRLSMQPAEGFDASINDLLAMVGMDYSTRYNAEHVIDHVFANAVSLTDVMSNQGLLTTLWTHDPSLDVDDDGDGWTEIQGDCKDSATAIYPGAVETCGDGIDQDCNGVDQRCPADMDDDGDGWSENQGDCNDNNSASHPGAVETCGDGIDQNCDGTDPFCDFPIDPFDPQNYMPFDQGRMWTYRGSATKSGWATIYYDNILSVVGEKMIDGVKTTVFHETTPRTSELPKISIFTRMPMASAILAATPRTP